MSEGRLTDERLIELVVEYDRLGGEAKELGRLRELYRGTLSQAEADVSPKRVGSVAEYNRRRQEGEAAISLARREIQEAQEREAALRSRRIEVLSEMEAAGMPPGVWFRHGDEGVLLVRDMNGRLELRRALWEAVEAAPPGASVSQVEQLSKRTEAEGGRPMVARAAAPAAKALCLAIPWAAFAAYLWYLDPTWIGSSWFFVAALLLATVGWTVVAAVENGSLASLIDGEGPPA